MSAPGSERAPLADSVRGEPADPRIGDVDPEEVATVTVYLRRRAALPPEGTRLDRRQLAERHGADPTDIEAVRAFAADHGLDVVDADAGRRSVRLRGRLADLQTAFGASLARHRAPDGTEYRGRSGTLSVPAALAGVVSGVFGLDDRPQAAPRLRRAASATAGTSYTPGQVASAYGFPTGSDGAGERVGLIELGGGYRPADLETYFSGLGSPAPTVTAVPVDGAANSPGTANGPDGEVMLDIEVVGAAAPGAAIVVYFAPNTDQGFLDAVTTAVHDTTNSPSVLSISWGGPESSWTAAAMTQMEDALASAAAVGVTVTVAAGDNGSADGVDDGSAHVDFPASAPHALACGGTSLRIDTSGGIGSEVVWNDAASGGGATGGGVSAQFPVPSYQASAGVPPSANPGGGTGRGVPDVAGDADPDTGYRIRVDGTDAVIGGTSAVAPLWAALIARCNSATGHPAGFLQPILYATAGVCRDITSGTNGAYSAGPGWDACTGLGSPSGAAVLGAIQAASGGTTPSG